MMTRSRTLFVSLCCFVLTTTLTAADGDVKVMSYNIRYGTAKDGDNHWDKRKEFLAEVIKAYDPDLLGTQETLAAQRDFLAEKMPKYDVFGVGRDDGKEKGEMMAIYWRKERFEKLDGGHFWLSEKPEEVGSKSWDSSLPRLATWVRLKDKSKKGEAILWVNTHFDHMGKVARLESAKLIRDRINSMRKGASVILTGDFNSAEGSEPYKALFDLRNKKDLSPVEDSYRVLHPKREENEGTTTPFKSAPSKGGRIDWIGVSHDWKVLAAEIVRPEREGRTASDHFPVTATLRR
jgi:endonuclease/exonuclease/phosphatase family metal-dependent hydrolase